MDFKLLVLLALLALQRVSGLSFTPDEEDPDAFKDPEPETTTTKVVTTTAAKSVGCGQQVPVETKAPEPKPTPKSVTPRKLPSRKPLRSRTRSTPKPRPSRQPIRQRTTPKPQSRGPKMCPTVTAVFGGRFHNKIRPFIDSRAQFQVRLYANQTNQMVYAKLDNWNEKISSSKNFQWGFTYNWCKIGEVCTHPFKDFWGLYLLTAGMTNDYHFLYFKDFNGQFRLEETFGQCTKVQAKHECEYETDKALHDYCICCGDQYNPDPSLGCPKL